MWHLPQSNTTKSSDFWKRKNCPPLSGTLTIGCGCGTATTKEAAIAFVPPSPHRIVHNDSVQIYEEPPAPVRARHSLANWTSVRE